jgi:AI-2 transport protein TqsA
VSFLHSDMLVTAADRTAPLRWTTGIIAAVAVIWLFRAAAVVVMPLAAAFFIAIVIHPVQVWLHQRLRRYGWAAVPLTMALFVAILGGGIWAMAEALDEAAEQAPKYAGTFQQRWQEVVQFAEHNGIPLPQDVTSSSATSQGRITGLATAALRTAWDLLSGLVLVFFLVLLMLLEASDWGRTARRVMPGRESGKGLHGSVTMIAGKVRQYLYVRTVLGAISAAIAGVWLLLLGVDLVLVWVLLTFLLNYIPNLGSIIAVVPPSLMALLQHGPLRGALVLGGLAIFEQIIGNYIDPRMQGRRLQISPVVVLVALVFWTWLWGPAGALLAVPMTVTILAAASHSETLRPLTVLLAHENEHDESRGE